MKRTNTASASFEIGDMALVALHVARHAVEASLSLEHLILSTRRCNRTDPALRQRLTVTTESALRGIALVRGRVCALPLGRKPRRKTAALRPSFDMLAVMSTSAYLIRCSTRPSRAPTLPAAARGRNSPSPRTRRNVPSRTASWRRRRARRWRSGDGRLADRKYRDEFWKRRFRRSSFPSGSIRHC